MKQEARKFFSVQVPRHRVMTVPAMLSSTAEIDPLDINAENYRYSSILVRNECSRRSLVIYLLNPPPLPRMKISFSSAADTIRACPGRGGDAAEDRRFYQGLLPAFRAEHWKRKKRSRIPLHALLGVRERCLRCRCSVPWERSPASPAGDRGPSRNAPRSVDLRPGSVAVAGKTSPAPKFFLLFRFPFVKSGRISSLKTGAGERGANGISFGASAREMSRTPTGTGPKRERGGIRLEGDP